jgi:5-methylcytosine-specific restriction endonuclease McrA
MGREDNELLCWGKAMTTRDTNSGSCRQKQPMKRPPLEEFLEPGGAEILPVTNPWELVRFKTARGTHVVYNNAKGNKAYSDNHAQDAYRAYIDGKKWIAQEKVQRRSRRYLETAIRRRDGDDCFFCCRPFTEVNPATIEHLLAISSGGSNGLANLALAHESCNMLASDLSVVEKVKLREKMKGQS